MATNNSKEIISKLESLVEVSKVLNSSLKLKDILEKFRQSTKSKLEAKFCTIYLINKERQTIYSVAMEDPRLKRIELPVGKGISGYVAQTGKHIITNDAYKDNRFDSFIDKQIGGHTNNLCTVPMRNHIGKIIGVIQLMNKKGGFSDEDAEFLEALAIPAAIAVENAKLHQKEVANKELMKDMELASKVQRMILPEKFPFARNLKASIVYKPYHQVSGDIYDFVGFSDTNTGIAIGDVSGKGVSAALIMSMIATLFSSLSISILSTKQMCSILNNTVVKFTKSRRFCTFFYSIINTETKKIYYTNAGHNPPILIKSNGDIITLKGGGAVLGAIDNTEYEQLEENFTQGDTLLLYTDGVTESRNTNGEMYSHERLLKRAEHFINHNTKPLAELIENDLKDFIEDYQHQDDDYTIISIKYN
jgi:phosphoserine phosphatase RsbU/P